MVYWCTITPLQVISLCILSSLDSKAGSLSFSVPRSNPRTFLFSFFLFFFLQANSLCSFTAVVWSCKWNVLLFLSGISVDVALNNRWTPRSVMELSWPDNLLCKHNVGMCRFILCLKKRKSVNKKRSFWNTSQLDDVSTCLTLFKTCICFKFSVNALIYNHVERSASTSSHSSQTVVI